MKKRFKYIFMLMAALLMFSGCDLLDEFLADENQPGEEVNQVVIKDISELKDIEYFRSGALKHILEGELNGKGQAVGFHYDHLPSKKGHILEGTETEPNDYGIYEAEVEVEGTRKTSNKGMSSFFPDHWSAQDVVDGINEAYESNSYLTGNTYEGMTSEGVVIRMYLDNEERIISAFPVY